MCVWGQDLLTRVAPWEARVPPVSGGQPFPAFTLKTTGCDGVQPSETGESPPCSSVGLACPRSAAGGGVGGRAVTETKPLVSEAAGSSLGGRRRQGERKGAKEAERQTSTGNQKLRVWFSGKHHRKLHKGSSFSFYINIEEVL